MSYVEIDCKKVLKYCSQYLDIPLQTNIIYDCLVDSEKIKMSIEHSKIAMSINFKRDSSAKIIQRTVRIYLAKIRRKEQRCFRELMVRTCQKWKRFCLLSALRRKICRRYDNEYCPKFRAMEQESRANGMFFEPGRVIIYICNQNTRINYEACFLLGMQRDVEVILVHPISDLKKIQCCLENIYDPRDSPLKSNLLHLIFPEVSLPDKCVGANLMLSQKALNRIKILIRDKKPIVLAERPAADAYIISISAYFDAPFWGGSTALHESLQRDPNSIVKCMSGVTPLLKYTDELSDEQTILEVSLLLEGGRSFRPISTCESYVKNNQFIDTIMPQLNFNYEDFEGLIGGMVLNLNELGGVLGFVTVSFILLENEYKVYDLAVGLSHLMRQCMLIAFAKRCYLDFGNKLSVTASNLYFNSSFANSVKSLDQKEMFNNFSLATKSNGRVLILVHCVEHDLAEQCSRAICKSLTRKDWKIFDDWSSAGMIFTDFEPVESARKIPLAYIAESTSDLFELIIGSLLLMEQSLRNKDLDNMHNFYVLWQLM